MIKRRLTDSALFDQIQKAAVNKEAVAGLTHGFYRYPARFSPVFASSVIEAFSKPGDLVLDPFAGGGTTVVQALAARRNVVGNDCNSLSIFLCRAKTTTLSDSEMNEARRWFGAVAGTIDYRYPRSELVDLLSDPRVRNLDHHRARAIKKATAICLQRIGVLSTNRLQRFARCVVLRTVQWALDGRRKHTTLDEFRVAILQYLDEMLTGLQAFTAARSNTYKQTQCHLVYGDAAQLHRSYVFRRRGQIVDLVVTSPPYPGVHVLYHRWQVNGRRETPAPYWIADCVDGHGAAHYTFCDRKCKGLEGYFSRLLATFKSVRSVTRSGAYLVQLVAFSKPEKQLPLYLDCLTAAGFSEELIGSEDDRRIWREVPNRKWHAALKGNTTSSREVLLVHRAL